MVNVHGDIRHRILNRADNAVGDARPEPGRDLEIERVARRDRICRAVGNRGGGLIRRSGQLGNAPPVLVADRALLADSSPDQ